MGRKQSRKVKTADQVREEARQSMRNTLTAAGVPIHRVAGNGVNDFTVAQFTDIAKHRNEKRSVLRVSYPGTVDRWLLERGPGFDDPQRRAIDHCRTLWALVGSSGSVANYGGIGSAANHVRSQMFEHGEALTQLAKYRDDIPNTYWTVFERMCRDDFSASEAGKMFAMNDAQRTAHTKSCVGFVASLIAQWNGF